MAKILLAALLVTLSHVTVAAQISGAIEKDPQDSQAAYKRLVDSFKKSMASWQIKRKAAIKKAREAGQPTPRSALRPPTKTFIDSAQKLADKYFGKDVSVPFHAFIVETVCMSARRVKMSDADRKAAKLAINVLALRHDKSPAIADVISLQFLANCRLCGELDAGISLIDKVADHHPLAGCRAKGLVARGTLRIRDGDTKAGAKDLRQVPSLTKDVHLLAKVTEALFAIDRLAIGQEVPEILGVDIDGVAFKLSDYRGKVVLLDFWGFW